MDQKTEKIVNNVGVLIGLLSIVAFGIAIYANVLSIKVNRKALGKSK